MTAPIRNRNGFSWLTARPIAHRGLHKAELAIVENTATAFAGAIEGNYAIECDLQISADGEAMVFHDETLDRLTEKTGLLKAMKASDLQLVPFKCGVDRMQTLRDLLLQVRGQVPLVIELKSHFDGDTRLAKRALEVLSQYDGPHCLMSFDPDLIEYAAVYSPPTMRGITADHTADEDYHFMPAKRRLSLRHLQHMDKTKPDFISYDFHGLPFQPVTSFRAQGRPVITWTIRSRAEEQQAREFSDQVTFEGYLA